MTLKELRRKLIKKLEGAKNTSPHSDVDFILLYLLGLNKTDIIIGDRKLTDEEVQKITASVERVADGEPVQYVAGVCEFMSLNFKVNPSTLIPRADTEILVESVMDFCNKTGKYKILEIGCGSGCIAVSLAHYLKAAQVFAIDISQGALDTSAENAKLNGAGGKIEFFKHDIMSGFPQIGNDVDVVVSNPPYIPANVIDELEKKVKAFEPRTALDGGEDGLDFYRRIAECAKLNPGGLLAFEVGYDQAGAVMEIMKQNGYSNIRAEKDLSGIERVVLGER